MIRNLNGIRETVSFEKNSTIMLYDNDEAENYPIHWHIPLEIIMPTINHYMVDCNNTTFDLRVEDILFIAPGTLHKFSAPPVGKRIIFQAAISSFDKIRGLETFTTSIRPFLLITPENAPLIHSKIVKLMTEIKNEYCSNSPMAEISIYSMLFEIMVLLSRNYTNNTTYFSDVKLNKQEEYIEKYRTICEYINQNCMENLTLDNIANVAGFSKYHFERLFKEFTNMSFYKYLSYRRIVYAERLLIDPDCNITEIAYKSGFNSISAFIRMFRIVNNCTPTEFRNMYQLTLCRK